LTESVLLAFLGGVLGLLLAGWADVLLVRMVSQGPEMIPLDVNPDARILGFTFGISLLTGILFGLAPALRATRLDLAPALKPMSRGGTGAETGGGRVPVGKVLVISQVALSLALLVVAGLFVRSLQKLGGVQLGYTRDNLLLFQIDPVTAGYKGEAAPRLLQELLDRLTAIPGARGVTLSENGLFSHHESGDPIWVEGYTPKSEEEMHSAIDQVGPNYFTAVGIPVLMGRDMGPQDTASAPRVGLVNQTFAKKFFGAANPIGKHVRDVYPDNPGELEVVGVVADAKYNSLKEKTPPRLYAPYFHPLFEASDPTFEIRVAGSPAAAATMVREVVKAIDPGLPALRIRTMEELVDNSLARDRMIARLSSLFGMVALLLASIGLYGVMAFTVARRTNEIGIRMALGAERGTVLRLMLGMGTKLVLIGLAVGMVASIFLTRFLQNQLFQVPAVDPISLIGVTILLSLAALLASYIPADRAARLDPMTALRHE
jgi:predicted permease